MPLAHGHHDAGVLPSCLDEMAAGFVALAVVEDPEGLAAKHGDTFRALQMTMNRKFRARLQGIQHALGVVIRRVAQVIVLPQARAGLGLGGEGV